MRVLVIGDTRRRIVASKDGKSIFRMPYTDTLGRRMKKRLLKQSISTTGYYRVASPAGGERFVHRIVASQYLEDWDQNLEVDHINGDKVDNRIENLRMVTKQQQAMGFQSHRGGTSKYRGVSKNKGKKTFDVYVNMSGKRYRTYGITDEMEAALEFDRLARGLGFPEDGLNYLHFQELREVCA